MFLKFVLALSATLTGAYCVSNAQSLSASGTYYVKQAAPFGHTINPQGTWSLGAGFLFDSISVEIGTIVNNVFTPLPGTTTRYASIQGGTWTAAAYTGLNANTTYSIRARLYLRTLGPPPGLPEMKAESIATRTTGQ